MEQNQVQFTPEVMNQAKAMWVKMQKDPIEVTDMQPALDFGNKVFECLFTLADKEIAQDDKHHQDYVQLMGSYRDAMTKDSNNAMELRIEIIRGLNDLALQTAETERTRIKDHGKTLRRLLGVTGLAIAAIASIFIARES